MFEVHVTHVMKAITGEKTKGPRRDLYTRLQKQWPKLCQEIEPELEKDDRFVKFDWSSSVQVGSPLHCMALKALEFGQHALACDVFPRGDYKQLCRLLVFYLGGQVTGLRFLQPGACHEARFMADSLYILTLQLTQNITNFLSDDEIKMLETSSVFILIFYGPWLLKSYLTHTAPANDLEAFHDAYALSEHYPDLAAALIQSMQRHAWYLTEEMVVLALADDDIQGQKVEIMARLLSQEAPESFRYSKPELPNLSRSTRLVDLVGPHSWHLLQVAGIKTDDVKQWIKARDVPETLKSFVKSLASVNDCSERNIRLIQDFIDSSSKEDRRQNVMNVTRAHRKKLTSLCTKEELKNL